MKKLLLVLVMAFVASNAYAGHAFDINNNFYSTNHYDQTKNEFGTKLDAPYLVEVYKNWFIGVEGGKDLYSTSMSEGWNSYLKVTYTGTVYSFRKDK